MPNAALEAGLAALKVGDARAASEHLARAVQQDPQDAQAHAYLGAAYGQLQMAEQAIQHLTRATQLAPHSAAFHFNLGVILAGVGRCSEAAAALRQALAADPGYDRARQALERLGESAPAAPPSPASAPAAATAPAAPAAPPSGPGVGEFILPGSEPTAMPVAASAYAPTIVPSSPQAPTIPDHAWPGGPLPPPGPPAPPVPGPPGGRQPLGDWTPPAPAPELQMGANWSAPPPEEGGLANWQAAPPRPTTQIEHTGTGAVIARAEAPERSLSRQEKLGHCYLKGMGMGVWWGVIGAVILFMYSLLNPASQLVKVLPVVFTACLMSVAFGTLIYGVIGMIGGSTDDAETTCGNLGIALGILTALVLMPTMLGFLTMGAPMLGGCIWVSRQMGKSLGISINEMNASFFVVGTARGVTITPMR